LWDFTQYISSSKLFISTSTGPMHLAGLSNSKTMSFFGSSSFASSKRWSTISLIQNQYNFEVKENYLIEDYKNIENKLLELVK